MKTHLLIIALLLLFFPLAGQQRQCTTLEWEEHRRHVHAELPPLSEEYLRLQKEIIRHQQNNRTKDQKEEIYRIPVIIHVIHNGEPVGEETNISAAQVTSQIAALNEDFRRKNADTMLTHRIFRQLATDARIEFVPATIDTFGIPLPEPGIHRYHGGRKEWRDADFSELIKPLTCWNPKQYFNIWVANLERGTLGYAQFPEVTRLGGLNDYYGSAATDGVVVDYDNFGSIDKINTPQLLLGAPFNKGRTLTHEMGHAFGLLHIWGDKSGCGGNDFCNDTPPALTANYLCDPEKNTCGNLNMIQNYMDYTEDACMNLFTADQVLRMRTVLMISPRRRELPASPAAHPVQAGVYAWFEPSVPQLCTGQPLTFRQKCVAVGNAVAKKYSWYFPGGNPAVSSQENPSVSYEKPGFYEAMLIVESNLGIDTLKRNACIRITALPESRQAAQEDFSVRTLNESGWLATGGWQTAPADAKHGTALVLKTPDHPAGHIARLHAPAVAAGGATTVEISFEVAYSFVPQTDSLIVRYSTDCGGSYHTIYKQGGRTLSTVAGKPGFLPAGESEWRKVTLYAEVKAAEGIQVVFEGIGNRGNYIYLDNFSIRRLASPPALQARFTADRTLVMPGEKISLQNLSVGASRFRWDFAGASASTDYEPEISFAAPGLYPVSLTAGHLNQQHTQTAEIRVVKATFLDNIGARSTAPGNRTFAKGKAEYFEITVGYEQLAGADIRFSSAAGLPGDLITVKVWEAVADPARAVPGNAQLLVPGAVLTSKTLQIGDIQNDMVQKRATRIAFDPPVLRPGNFFIGFESDQSTEIYTAGAAKNTAWEMNVAGQWVPLTMAASIGVFPSAYAIFPLMIPGSITGGEELQVAEGLKIFPNPVTSSLRLELKEAQLTGYRVLNMLGQEVATGSKAAHHLEIDLAGQVGGMYLLHVFTDKGQIIRKIQVSR